MAFTADIEWRHFAGLAAYEPTLAAMEAHAAAIREAGAPQSIWLVEHPPLYTSGTSAKEDDLLDARFPVHHAGRGGQFTYHGPGQRVAYTMLDLKRPSPFSSGDHADIRAFVTFLETWLINTLACFGLSGRTYSDRVGVWVDTPAGEAKIAAIGIRIRRWVSFHGIALNVNPDLAHFSGIVPCGIRDRGVTSLAELGCTRNLAEVDAILQREFTSLYQGF